MTADQTGPDTALGGHFCEFNSMNSIARTMPEVRSPDHKITGYFTATYGRPVPKATWVSIASEGNGQNFSRLVQLTANLIPVPRRRRRPVLTSWLRNGQVSLFK